MPEPVQAVTQETPPPVVDAAAFQAQIDELKEQISEANRTAQFWAEKARQTPAAAAAPPQQTEEEPDVLEAITTGGAKGFDELAAKRGFVRKADVEQMIEAKAAYVTKEQALLSEYPDLKNRNSEFFKATAVRYGELYQQGVNQPLAMEMAARETELAFLRGGKMQLPGSAPSKADKEAQRLARISAQGGDGAGRRPAAAAEDDSELDDMQKHIADRMGVSYEAYAKRAKAGVAMRAGGR